MIRDDEPIISCLIVPRKGQSTANLQSDTESLGVPFKVIGLDKAGLHIDVEQGRIIHFLNAVFQPSYYEKYSFHLEKDEDDEPPEASEQTEPTAKHIVAKQKEINKLMQVRKPLRKPLQKTSESFDPTKLTPEDVILPGNQESKQETTNKESPSPIKESPAPPKTEPKSTPEDDASKTGSNTSKPKATTGGRKPIGGY